MGKVTKKKKTRKTQLVMFFLLLIAAIIILPTVINHSIRGLSYGAANGGIQFVQQGPHNSLQLEWFLLPTTGPSEVSNPSPVNSSPAKPVVIKQPTPTPGFPGYPPKTAPLCSPFDDQGVRVDTSCRCVDLEVDCVKGKPYTPDGRPFAYPTTDEPVLISPGQNPCGTILAPGSGLYCVAKPVIYLYPTKPQLVNVNLQTNGAIVVSDPHYPENGWKNILAHPDGTLSYNNKEYHELFYESSVNNFVKPDAGIVIPSTQLTEKLNDLVDQLGLVGSEKEEFMSFWVPRLKSLNSPYIFFSVIDAGAKKAVDNVIISPKPDTQIQFIAYFKPVLTADNDHVLQLPLAPKRVGFTSVEWGGIIDKN